MKEIYIISVFLFISLAGFCQDKIKKDSTQSDTTQYKLLQRVDINKPVVDSLNKNSARNHKIKYKSKKKILYRPTRLGSSSPRYDSYKENDYGAGSVTTNPKKSSKSFIYATPPISTDSLKVKTKDTLPPNKD